METGHRFKNVLRTRQSHSLCISFGLVFTPIWPLLSHVLVLSVNNETWNNKKYECLRVHGLRTSVYPLQARYMHLKRFENIFGIRVLLHARY